MRIARSPIGIACAEFVTEGLDSYPRIVLRSGMLTSGLSVAAVMMVRNEQHIIASCIGHLLTTLGVSRVYVTDNGSSDDTWEILRRIAARTDRVVLGTHPGEFRQAEILTILAQRAVAAGAEWILPTDADEFLWLRPGVSLSELCRRCQGGGYRVPVCNFLQASLVRRDWAGSLSTMCVAALPFGFVDDGQAAVSSGKIPFLRSSYPTKLLLRATPSLELAFGHHDAIGTSGPLLTLEGGELLHAPMRSFEDLLHRIEVGRRAAIVTPDPGQNWHLKRIAAMDQVELAEEWRRNSYSLLRPIEPGATRLDFRLRRVGLQQAAFRRRFQRPGNGDRC